MCGCQVISNWLLEYHQTLARSSAGAGAVEGPRQGPSAGWTIAGGGGGLALGALIAGPVGAIALAAVGATITYQAGKRPPVVFSSLRDRGATRARVRTRAYMPRT